jgi:hypothetical protein
MKKAFDATEVRLLLRRGLEAGHWTVEDLDQPSHGWRMNAKAFALHYPKYQQPQYRNLLRDEPTTAERVEIVSPRDFAVASTPADQVQRGGAPVLLGADRPVAQSFSDEGMQRHEGSVGDEADHGNEAHLGATGQGSSSGVGELSDDW